MSQATASGGEGGGAIGFKGARCGIRTERVVAAGRDPHSQASSHFERREAISLKRLPGLALRRLESATARYGGMPCFVGRQDGPAPAHSAPLICRIPPRQRRPAGSWPRGGRRNISISHDRAASGRSGARSCRSAPRREADAGGGPVDAQRLAAEIHFGALDQRRGEDGGEGDQEGIFCGTLAFEPDEKHCDDGHARAADAGDQRQPLGEADCERRADAQILEPVAARLKPVGGPEQDARPAPTATSSRAAWPPTLRFRHNRSCPIRVQESAPRAPRAAARGRKSPCRGHARPPLRDRHRLFP